MRNKLPILLSGAAMLALPLSAQTTLLDETFDPADFNEYGGGNTDLNPSDPKNSGDPSWYRYAISDSEFFVTDPGGELNMDKNGTNVNFSSFSLDNTGDSITLEFDATYLGSDSNGLDFRIALTDANIGGNGGFPNDVDGLRADLGYGGSTASRFGVIDDGDDMDGNLNANGKGFFGSFNAGITSTTTTNEWTITRNASDGLDLSFAQDGSSVITNETLAASDVSTYSFSNLSGFIAGTPQQWTLDNVTVTSVPEPGTFALLAGLFALGSIALRRRR